MATPRHNRGRPPKRMSTNMEDQDFMTHTISTASEIQPTTPRYTALGTPSILRSATRRTPRAGPLTPFGLRAIQRRVNTPGRDRRRSTRGPQQETAFDILRNLGRTLAPISKPIQSSPQEERSPSPEDSSSEEEDETLVLDNEPLPERPRLSLPIDVDSGTSENGSPDLPPPRLSLQFDEDDITQRSVEYPRRAISEQDRQRLERMSFGDVRLSENFGDLTRLDAFSEHGDTTMFPQDDDGGGIEQSQLDEAAFDAGGETADLGRFNLDFNFPSPVAPAAGLDPLRNEEEDFMLQTEQADDIPYPSSDDAGAGDFGGFEVNMADQVSDAGTTGTAEAGAELVGGGLRDEPRTKSRKEKKLSRHGIPVPTLPTGVVKRLATRFARVGAGAKSKINKETLTAIEQASEWFFEQASEDLATYAKHANRKTIDESDYKYGIFVGPETLAKGAVTRYTTVITALADQPLLIFAVGNNNH
ncbi:hypothetical protein UA08_01991 [Talaromyces atroroseus]|uniref:CENP-T/Histone H4 histone fold domain-containing protein n=1 Tax=Talaromyces atroroseus TaxID=1441469 RepID=A0A1Q5QAF8_TALAT|nr:hypothetical protein UA08_01991 [Talaromyces atroroseus]OKL62915.1 hypothetical protein UA08_01991 [Talaromyces atroroseus]